MTCPFLSPFLFPNIHHLPPTKLPPLSAVLPPPLTHALTHLLLLVTLPPPLCTATVIWTRSHLTAWPLDIVITVTDPSTHITAATATARLLVVVAGAAVHREGDVEPRHVVRHVRVKVQQHRA